jgi:prephenate dehydrogenase
MMRRLPKNVTLLGTHPFFGPDTVRRSLRGRTIVLCPVRIPSRHLSRMASVLRQSGLNVRVVTPEEHDRLVSRTVLLTQYIGRLIRMSDIPPEDIVTAPYASLLELADVAARDDLRVFTDMWRYNSYSRELSIALRKGQRHVERLLRAAPRRGLHNS